MSQLIETIKPLGEVERIIEYSDGTPTKIEVFKNTVLRRGKTALAKTLANDLGGAFTFYVHQMVFGNAGTSGGAPRFVNTDRNNLFCGVPIVAKPVIASLDGSQVIFTSVLTFADVVGDILNEMAIVMYNEDFYSMVTFPDLTKTGSMQITWNWRLSFV